MQKFDPYINIDPGTMNPIQHGEVFVTDDGAETDLDLGHYERFIDESLTKNSNVTTGKVYWSVLQKERRGDFGGGTVQVIPHITNEIKSRFYRNFTSDETHIAIIEVGGTVGDIESQPFLEAIRQFQHEVGHENAILIHVTLIPYIKASGELKTKPTQASVKELQGMGIQPDIIVCRSEHELDQSLKDKIALFCNVPNGNVLQNLDVEYLYEAPLAMEKENLAKVACKALHLDCPEPDLKDWEAMVDSLRHPNKEVKIALVGKYIALHDAYISVVEALKHGGIAEHATVNIKWVDSEELTPENIDEFNEKIELIAMYMSQYIDVDRLLKVAKCAPNKLVYEKPEVGKKYDCVVAIAKDEAFCFNYDDNVDMLRELGCTVKFFSPLEDSHIPEDADGLILSGGYPELYAKKLSENTELIDDIRLKIQNGMPTIAECGGFMYLHKTIEDEAGRIYPMAGIIDGECSKGKRLNKHFGYITMTASRDNVLCKKGEQFTAHEFHYYNSTNDGHDFKAVKPVGGRNWITGNTTPTFYGGFPHIYFKGNENVVYQFLDKCSK